MEIIRERNPLFEAELRRDFKPEEVVEANFAYRAITAEGRMVLLHRRQRKVRFRSLDGNSICETVVDLGPATQDQAITVPCGGENEIAHVFELLDWAARRRAELRARRAEVQPLRDAAFLASLQNYAEEFERRRRGISTFGYGGQLQRVSA